jgi:hypothetical protein
MRNGREMCVSHLFYRSQKPTFMSPLQQLGYIVQNILQVYGRHINYVGALAYSKCLHGHKWRRNMKSSSSCPGKTIGQGDGDCLSAGAVGAAT